MLQRVLALALCCFSLCIKDGIAFLASGVRLGSVGEDRSNAIRAQRLGPCDTLWYGIGAMPNRNRYTVSSRPAQKQTQGKGSASNTCLWDTFGEFESSSATRTPPSGEAAASFGMDQLRDEGDEDKHRASSPSPENITRRTSSRGEHDMTPLSIPASKPSSAGVDAKEAVDSSTWKSPIRGSEHAHGNPHGNMRQHQEVDGVMIHPKASPEAKRQAVDLGVQNVLRQALSGKQTTQTLVDTLESYTSSPAGSMEYAVNSELANMFYQAHSGRRRSSVDTGINTNAEHGMWERISETNHKFTADPSNSSSTLGYGAPSSAGSRDTVNGRAKQTREKWPPSEPRDGEVKEKQAPSDRSGTVVTAGKVGKIKRWWGGLHKKKHS